MWEVCPFCDQWLLWAAWLIAMAIATAIVEARRAIANRGKLWR